MPPRRSSEFNTPGLATEQSDDISLQLREDALGKAGFVHVGGLLSRRSRSPVLREALALRFDPLEAKVGRVSQSGEIHIDALPETTSHLKRLGEDLRSLVEPWLSENHAAATGWPNEVSVMRYRRGEGISSHRDLSRYLWLVASVTLVGRASVSISGAAEPLVVGPGDVLLLAGSGAGERPAHSVTTTSSVRVAATFRYDAEQLISDGTPPGGLVSHRPSSAPVHDDQMG